MAIDVVLLFVLWWGGEKMADYQHPNRVKNNEVATI